MPLSLKQKLVLLMDNKSSKKHDSECPECGHIIKCELNKGETLTLTCTICGKTYKFTLD